MKNLELSTIANVFNGKTPSKSEQKAEGIPILKIKDTDSEGDFKTFSSWVDTRFEKKYGNKKLRAGDTLLLNAAHNSSHVGSKTFYVDQSLNDVIATGEWMIIRPHTDRIDSRYLNYYLASDSGLTQIRHHIKGIHIYPKDVSKIKVPVPKVEVQRMIVSILNRANAIRKRYKQIQLKYRDLSQSLFYEMFGNGDTEILTYDIVALSEIGEIVSGVTLNSKGVDPKWNEFAYLRVANVQDGYLNLSEIKKVKVNDTEFKKFALKRNDILLTEGGDPDKLGRGTIWNEEIPNCIHQNHIFRVRIISKEFSPVFVSQLMSSRHGKRYFLKAAKQTTGIASINSTQLKAFPVVKPPIKLQNKFETIVTKCLVLKDESTRNEKSAELLFKALLHQAFNGTLVKN